MSHSTPRRSFLGRAAATVAAMVGGSVLGRDLGAQPDDGGVPSPIPPQRALTDEWDMSWVDRLTGKYRAVFDSPEIVEGTALTQTRTWLNGYTEVYGVRPAELSAVLVIRHAAIPLILNDNLWNELELGGIRAASSDAPQPLGSILRDPVTGEPARRNPFLSTSMKGDAKFAMTYPDGGFDSLMADGVIVLACNLALRRPIGMVMRRDGVDNATARAKVLANILPGVIVMPSGIFATTRAQAAGCAFMQA